MINPYKTSDLGNFMDDFQLSVKSVHRPAGPRQFCRKPTELRTLAVGDQQLFDFGSSVVFKIRACHLMGHIALEHRVLHIGVRG